MKISVITPCFNREDVVSYAVDSVLAQGDIDFEHIVVDGASTDGTHQALVPYHHLYIDSQADENMYDAISRGPCPRKRRRRRPAEQ